MSRRGRTVLGGLSSFEIAALADGSSELGELSCAGFLGGTSVVFSGPCGDAQGLGVWTGSAVAGSAGLWTCWTNTSCGSRETKYGRSFDRDAKTP
jgi:hypothetical protein